MKSMLKTRRLGYKKRLSFELRCLLCIVPSFIGITIFHFIPYIRVLYFSFINNQFQKNFVGFDNYAELFANKYFLLAFKNSIILVLVGVPLLVVFSILISIAITFVLKKISWIKDSFIFPFLVPTAGIIVIWQQLFNWSNSALPIYILYIWKNSGILIILLLAAISTIEKSMYEAAKLDGCNGIRIHQHITIPMITPTIFFTSLFGIVNSFKIFKESYLYYGNQYPPNHSYTLQYYMNNNFLKFNYKSLSTSSIVTSMFVLLIILGGLYVQRRYKSE